MIVRNCKKQGCKDEHGNCPVPGSDNDIYTGLPTVPVKNTKDVELYVLILASKHPLAQKIWNSVIKIDPKGQKELF